MTLAAQGATSASWQRSLCVWWYIVMQHAPTHGMQLYSFYSPYYPYSVNLLDIVLFSCQCRLFSLPLYLISETINQS